MTTIKQAAHVIASELTNEGNEQLSRFVRIAEAVEKLGVVFQFKTDAIREFTTAIADEYAELNDGAALSKGYLSKLGAVIVGISAGLAFELTNFKIDTVATSVREQLRANAKLAKVCGYVQPKREAKHGTAQKAGKVDGYAVPKTPALRVLALRSLCDAVGITLTTAQEKKLGAVA